MLNIRAAQVQALGSARLQAFKSQLATSLRRGRPGVAADLPGPYLDEVVALSVATCHEHGHDQQATMAGFAESMLKDDPHPMTPERMKQKADTILRELEARARFVKLQALQASLSGQQR